MSLKTGKHKIFSGLDVTLIVVAGLIGLGVLGMSGILIWMLTAV